MVRNSSPSHTTSTSNTLSFILMNFMTLILLSDANLRGHKNPTIYSTQNVNTKNIQQEQQQQMSHIPDILEYNLLDISAMVKKKENESEKNVHHTPLFWHVPKAGGTTMHVLFTKCLNLVVASEVGVTNGHDQDKTLQIVKFPDGRRYVNIDTSTIQGIERAKQLHFAQSGLADVVISHRLHAICSAFTAQNNGRMFALFRHPIERASSLFYYLQDAEWEKTYNPALKNMTLADYARSGKVEHNWMVRSLVGKSHEELSEEDLKMAKGILRRKCLVGLLSEMEESVERFAKFFGWKQRGSEGVSKCQDGLLHGGGSNKNRHPKVEEGSKEWNLLMKNNRFDMELYDYAVDLFEEQGKSIAVADWESDVATRN